MKKKNIKKIKGDFKKGVNEFFDALIICTAIIALTLIFLGQPVEVIGNSMLPNFENKERILAEKISIKIKSPKRADIVILKHPKETNKYVIKRVVGLPGETLTIKKGSVYINDRKLEENYLTEETMTLGMNAVKEDVPEKIPADNYIVLGDNREDSSDSRNWGVVTKESIIGKAVIVYYPFENFRVISL